MFLTPEQVADLTGIKRGRKGKSRGQLQCEHLRKNGIPFFQNACGDPKVACAYIEGRVTDVVKPETQWQPNVLKKAA